MAANQNFNGSTTFLVRRASNNADDNNNACTYLKFALGTQSIVSATLNVRVDSTSAPPTGVETVKCYAIPNTSWTAGAITWNNAPNLDRSTSFWQSIGGTFLTQKNVSLQSGTSVSFDVTSYVRAHLGQTIAFQLIDEANPPDNQTLYIKNNQVVNGRLVFNLTLSFLYSSPFGETPVPAWAQEIVPTDTVPIGGNGPSSADSVNLASGVEENRPGPDIVVRNPNGPDVSYTRMYRSLLAYQGYASPGLSSGWVDNYDVRVQGPAQMGAWGPLTLIYPNGATEQWTVPSFSGTGTVTLTPPTGTPYAVTGQPSTTMGVWNSLTITFKDRTSWTFMGSNNLYRLVQIADLLYPTDPTRHAAQIVRFPNGSLNYIADPTGNHLLHFGYSNGYLSTVTDVAAPLTADQRQVVYTFGYLPELNQTCLLNVSQIVLPGTPSPPTRWQYAYQTYISQPFLTSVTVPDPTGGVTGRSHPITYGAYGRVASLVDALGNQRNYTYNTNNTTQVDIKNSSGLTIQSWKQKFGALNNDTGTTDASNNSDSIFYADATNPLQVTGIQNKNGQTTAFTYDNTVVASGNLKTITPPRTNGMITTYNYDYMTFPLGLLYEVQEGTKTSTRFTYNTSGLLWKIDTPLPGSPSGSQQRVTAAEFLYNARGNVTEVRVPMPNSSMGATGTVSILYTYGDDNYAPDPYSKTEALGEPVTITVPISTNPVTNAVTHLRYDPRGNVKTIFDPLGYRTDYHYNEADQLTKIDYPYTGTNPSLRAATVYTYLYPGGPLVSTTDLDENGQQVNGQHQTSRTGGKEDELTQLSGSTQQTALTYDSQFRPSQVKDAYNNAESFFYNLVGYLIKQTYPLLNSTTGYDSLQALYDADGNLTQRTDGRGLMTIYGRATDDSRLTGKSYSSGAPGVVYNYDLYGRITEVSDGLPSSFANYDIQYTYDDLDNITSVRTTYKDASGNQLAAQTISYTYNSDGTRATMTTPAGIYRYTYDLAGRLTKVQCPWTGGTYTYTYDLNDRLIQQHMSKADTFFTYNSRGFLTDLKNTSTLLTAVDRRLSEFTGMQYDAVGNRWQATVTIPKVLLDPTNANSGSNTGDANGMWTAAYDNKDRLIGERRTLTGRPDLYNNVFVSDLADNFTTLRGPNTAQNMFYNQDNQVQGSPYDGNGNLLSYQGSGLAYDDENRLISVNGLMSALWRDDGLRAWKQNNQNQRTYFFYDGDRVIYEIKTGFGPNPLTRAYGYGPNGLVQRFYTENNAYIAYTFDPWGNLVQRHRQFDTLLAADLAAYDGLGRLYKDVDAQTGGEYPHIDPIGPQGQWGIYTDEETRPEALATGFSLQGDRYYDGFTARFLTRGSAGVNEYAAGDNNPTEGFAAGRFIGGLLASGLGGYYGGPVGAAVGFGAWEGLYSYAEGNSLETAITQGASAGIVGYAGGRFLGAVGNVIGRTRVGQAGAGAINRVIGGAGTGSRGPIFADANLLIHAQRGSANALAEIRAGPTYITPNQFREFIAGGGAVRRAFLRAEGVQIFGGPQAGNIANSPVFRDVFRHVVASGHGRGDAALLAFARATGIPAVTAERRLFNFAIQTLPQRLGAVPIRRVVP